MVRMARTRAGTCPEQPHSLLRPDLRKRWVAVLLAALLAFTWQSFVTQTHVHFGLERNSAAAGSSAAAPSRPIATQSSTDLPADCVFCQEVAHAGHYLLPAPIAFQAPEPVAAWLLTIPLPVLTRNARSHAWRSRAPPLPLQA
jgi:hypothetical protein